MIKRLIKIQLWLTGVGFFLVSSTAFPDDIPEISAVLSRDRIPLGETALLTVSAAWPGEASGFTFSKPRPPECRGLTIVGTSRRAVAWRTDGDSRRALEYLFTLRGDREGEARVGEVVLSYRRPDEETEHSLSTEPMEVTVTSGGEGIFSSFRSGLLFILVGLAAAAVIALYVRLTIRRYKKKSNEVIVDYVKNLETDTCRELDHVRKYRVRGEIDKYLERIWNILADYLEKKYTITISPDTWNEVLGGKRCSDLPKESETELSRILKILEESRFGSYQADNRGLDELLKRVYRFIESQKQGTI